METTAVKRFFWSVMTGFTTLLLIGMVALLLTGCNKFEIAKRKYATTQVDTTYQTITTVVPRDSVVLRTRTDTTRVFLTEKQGRATIIYQRDPKVTTIRAECDSVLKIVKVPVYLKKQVWGVDPAWKDKANDRMGIIWVLGTIIGISLLAFLFTYRYLSTLSRRTKEPVS